MPAASKVYVDTSALVALVSTEVRTVALKQWLRVHEQVPLVGADWCDTLDRNAEASGLEVIRP